MPANIDWPACICLHRGAKGVWYLTHSCKIAKALSQICPRTVLQKVLDLRTKEMEMIQSCVALDWQPQRIFPLTRQGMCGMLSRTNAETSTIKKLIVIGIKITNTLLFCGCMPYFWQGMPVWSAPVTSPQRTDENCILYRFFKTETWSM